MSETEPRKNDPWIAPRRHDLRHLHVACPEGDRRRLGAAARPLPPPRPNHERLPRRVPDGLVRRSQTRREQAMSAEILTAAVDRLTNDDILDLMRQPIRCTVREFRALLVAKLAQRAPAPLEVAVKKVFRFPVPPVPVRILCRHDWVHGADLVYCRHCGRCRATRIPRDW